MDDIQTIFDVIKNVPNVWKPAPVSEQPEVFLHSWRVFEVECEREPGVLTRHFVGRIGSSGRVSSAIQTFDSESGKGFTSSGRVYELVGPPGYSPDGLYVWGIWKDMNKVIKETDMSEECWNGRKT